MTKLTDPNSYKKVLLFLEEASSLNRITILDELVKQKIDYEIYIATGEMHEEKLCRSPFYFLPFSIEEISNVFQQQLIGTHLFIAGKWLLIQKIKEQALIAGFSEDEITISGMGPKEKLVFCVKCYSISSKKQYDVMSCEHCHTSLQISNHFSKRHNAYLGYIKIS